MPERRKVGNPLALAVLAELLMGPMHPYEIGRRLTEHGKDRNIKYNRGSLYMVVEQYRYRYPPVFEWPTLFPRARTLAWIAVVLLASDAVVDVVRSRARAREHARSASSRPGSRGGTSNPERKPGRDQGTA